MYGSEIWGVFSPASSKFCNGISLDKILKSTEAEKVHIKFGKFILGIHRKSANFAVMSDIGRYPFYLDIGKAMFKYWHCLKNLDESSLLHDALGCSKAIAGCNNSWYKSLQKRGTCIKGLFWPPLEPKTESCLSPISSYWFIKRIAQV